MMAWRTRAETHSLTGTQVSDGRVGAPFDQPLQDLYLGDDLRHALVSTVAGVGGLAQHLHFGAQQVEILLQLPLAQPRLADPARQCPPVLRADERDMGNDTQHERDRTDQRRPCGRHRRRQQVPDHRGDHGVGNDDERMQQERHGRTGRERAEQALAIRLTPRSVRGRAGAG